MALTPEAKTKAVIKTWLRILPHCWFFMPAAHGYGVSGIPDIIGCYRGVFFAIEVKAPGRLKRVTPLQQMQIDAINGAQGYACATETLEGVVEMFRMIDLSLDGNYVRLIDQIAELEALQEAEDRNRQEA